MAFSAGHLKVTAPKVGAVVIKVTGLGGSVPLLYTDSTLSTTISLPYTLAAGATLNAFFASYGTYTLSVTLNGVEGADPIQGTTKTFAIDFGMAAVFDYSLTDYTSGGVWNTGTGGAVAFKSRKVAAPVLGTYSVTQTTSNTTDTGVNTMVKRVLPAGISLDEFSLRYTNSAAGSNGDLDNANAITVVSAIGATTTGPWFPLTRGGARSMVIDPGEWIETDPISFHVAAGGTFYEKVFLSVTSGQVWTSMFPVGAAGTDYWASQSVGETDLHLSTAAFTPTTANRVYAAVTVVNQKLPANTASVAIIGDSIAGGLGDTGTQGYIWRALTGVLPYCRIAVSGSKLSGLVDPNVGRRRTVLIRGCNVAIDEYGINDVTTGQSLATIQANKLLLWNALVQRGMSKVYATTHSPVSTSSDTWITLVNQTTEAHNAVRTGLNDWYRDGAPIDATSLAAVAVGTTSNVVRAGASNHPLTGYFEVADITESARNSGLWKVTGAANYATADGTHPSTAMHILMAAAITPATLVAAAAA